jgi:hypothetical protein
LLRQGSGDEARREQKGGQIDWSEFHSQRLSKVDDKGICRMIETSNTESSPVSPLKINNGGAESDPLVDIPIQAVGPQQKTQQFPTRDPDETRDCFKSQSLSLLAGIRLYPPPQVFTSPGSEAIAAGCIPHKTNRSEQGIPPAPSIDGLTSSQVIAAC